MRSAKQAPSLSLRLESFDFEKSGARPKGIVLATHSHLRHEIETIKAVNQL